MNKILTASIVGTIAYFSFDYSNAGERVRFYEDDGNPTYEYAEKQFDGSWRVYDKKGKYQGKVTKDRFYNEKGRVKYKYYMLTK